MELCSRGQNGEFLSFRSHKLKDVFSWPKLRIFRNELGLGAILPFLAILWHPLFRKALIWASSEPGPASHMKADMGDLGNRDFD